MSSRILRSQVVECLRLTPICAGILAAGCGGAGAGTSGGSSGSPKTINAGIAKVSYSGIPHPLAVSSVGTVSAFSQAGASFSSFWVYPTPNLSGTTLGISRNVTGGSTEAFIAPADGSQQPSLLVHTTVSGVPSFSNSGLICLLTQVGGQYSIQTMEPDGSSVHVVVSNLAALPTISPNGLTIAYFNNNDKNIYTIPVAGGTPKLVYAGGNTVGEPVVWSHDGTQLAFTALNASTTHNEPYTIPAAGGVAKDVLPASLSGLGDAIVSSWSPDGQSLAFTWTPTSSSTSAIISLSMNGGGQSTLTPNGFSDSCPCFSPDNTKVAFYRTNAGGATPGIYEEDFSGTNPQIVIPDPSSDGQTGAVATLTWSPFQRNMEFIGTGGSVFGSTASGFLFA